MRSHSMSSKWSNCTLPDCQNLQYKMRRWIPVLLVMCVLGIACEAPTVWTADLKSPDGAWIASARTVQSGGMGTASIITGVSLKQAKASQSPMPVLMFSCNGPVQHPYVLDNEANAGGTIGLSMKWLSPSHLEVSYERHADLYFQAIRYNGIEISVRDLSAKNTDNQSR